jgi:hypothetical protein
VHDFALVESERRLLQSLGVHGIRFIVVGLGAALIEGAPVATLDLDLWLERIPPHHVGTVQGRRPQHVVGRGW